MSNPQAKPAPTVNIPPGNISCEVSIINTTCNLACDPTTLLEPAIPGHTILNLPTYAFLIKHPSGAQLLFDNGSRADWENLVPFVQTVVEARVPGLNVEREVPDILRSGHVDPDNLQALILSHWHYDHSGNIARLKPETNLIVGPGFKEAFEPGYPANPKSTFYEADFAGRNVIEPNFSDAFKVGKYQAHDYFDDGSLYILNVPGHTTGHISALVRTTEDTAVFLGGDVCHFTGVIRPTPFMPMPDPIPSSTPLAKSFPSPCPCLTFTPCHPNQTSPRTTPFYQCSTGPQSWYDDPATAMTSIRSLFEFDADPNIMVLIAHDLAPLDVLPFFPAGTINACKRQGWDEKMRWHFLNELPVGGVVWRKPIADGQYRNGVRVKDLEGRAV